MPTTARTLLSSVALAVALLGAASCSSGGDGGTDDVATLGAEDDTGSSDGDGGDDGPDGGGEGGRPVDAGFQDAMVEFAECMREHGIDMPDPQVGEGGGVVIAGPAGGQPGDGSSSEADREELEAADEACQPILEEARASMPEPDPEQQAEMQEQALEFAECMREHGIDMPDPVFGEGGRVSVEIGGAEGPGFDPEDDDFQEASEACGGEGGFRIGTSAPGADGGDD
jgi:hypothetical protein